MWVDVDKDDIANDPSEYENPEVDNEDEGLDILGKNNNDHNDSGSISIGEGIENEEYKYRTVHNWYMYLKFSFVFWIKMAPARFSPTTQQRRERDHPWSADARSTWARRPTPAPTAAALSPRWRRQRPGCWDDTAR